MSTENTVPAKRASCLGAGEGIDHGNRGGGARWNRRGICRVCGKSLALTPSGRIPRHVPKRAS